MRNVAIHLLTSGRTTAAAVGAVGASRSEDYIEILKEKHKSKMYL
jgi:hypothetical protein